MHVLLLLVEFLRYSQCCHIDIVMVDCGHRDIFQIFFKVDNASKVNEYSTELASFFACKHVVKFCHTNVWNFTGDHFDGKVTHLENSFVIDADWHDVNCLPLLLHGGEIRLQKPQNTQISLHWLVEFS